MKAKKLATLAVFAFGVIFIAVGVGVFFMPLNYITVNNIRQAATADNTRFIFLSVFGGIGLTAFLAGVVMAVKLKRCNSSLVMNY